ncbi:MAG: ATP-binding cassette domain-containing protein [Oscillospiraceae bacterium]
MKIGHVTKFYNGRKVLDIGGFEFIPDTVYAVIGTNGSGKSTLAKIIAGIIPADSGGTENGLKINYMPQKSYAFHMSVIKNVLVSSSSGEKDRRRAEFLLSSLGMFELLSSKAHRLSGGETSRMALARTLMKGCDVLVLDEPTAAMDVQSTFAAEELIKKYRVECGCTVILVTHSIKQAKRVADEVLFLHEGALVEYGSRSDVLEMPKEPLTKQFLDFYSM